MVPDVVEEHVNIGEFKTKFVVEYKKNETPKFACSANVEAIEMVAGSHNSLQ